MSEQVRVKVDNHWPTAKKEIEAKGRDLLIMVAFFLEQQFKLRVTDLGLIDTGFYRNSAYVSGLGVTTYGKGSGVGSGGGKRKRKFRNKHGEMVYRERAGREHPSRPKNAIIMGVAASYAYWLEQKAHPLMHALEAAKREFGGAGITINIKAPDVTG